VFAAILESLPLSYFPYEGAQMKISFTYKHVELREPVETETSWHLNKLGRLLGSYSPDLVQIHGSLEKHPRKAEYIFSLNLSLPTGTLHATGVGPDVKQSVKQAFAELEGQVKKHQSKLRKDYQWKRKRGRTEALA
jgi:ribosome-associated translation inhibitor RaiA